MVAIHEMSGAFDLLRPYMSMECVGGFVVAMAVLYMEVCRRAPEEVTRRRHATGVRGMLHLLWQYAPEVMGLAACIILAIYLRLHGSLNLYSTEDTAAYAAIMKQWPILLGADSLLALQAMLRVLVHISNAVRSRSQHVLLKQEAAGIAFGAALGRTVLLTLSRDYMLDGPLGGYLPIACEILSVFLLAALCKDMQRRAFTASALTLAVAALLGCRNRLALSDNVFADGLFLFAHTAELLAAFAYLSRALLSDIDFGAGSKSIALGFTHVLMPVQQCLAAYYFVQAFDFEPALVGAGSPFEILQMGGVAQVGAYGAASILYLAEYLETPSEDADDADSNRQQSMMAVPLPGAMSTSL